MAKAIVVHVVHFMPRLARVAFMSWRRVRTIGAKSGAAVIIENVRAVTYDCACLYYENELLDDIMCVIILVWKMYTKQYMDGNNTNHASLVGWMT